MRKRKKLRRWMRVEDDHSEVGAEFSDPVEFNGMTTYIATFL